MENAALLSPADVNVIRRYVQTKYAPLPRSKQAEIVADAVRNALARRLPDLPAPAKERLATALIRRCLVHERREVGCDDVLDLVEEAGLAAGETLDSLERWTKTRQPGQWTREQLASRLNRGGRGVGSAEVAAPPLAAVPAAAGLTAAPGAELAAPAPLAHPGDAGGAAWSVRAPWRSRAVWLALALAIVAGAGSAGLARQAERAGGPPAAAERPATAPGAAAQPGAGAEAAQPDAGMPAMLRYADIDAAAVKAYLRQRDSLLADEPYFAAIIASARKFDVHPLLLLAITGQEQGFVPRSGKNAKKIANNPYNVFHSWQEYNTTIADSSDIAARTLMRRGEKRPEDREVFEWLGLAYAEDTAWPDGVRMLFDKLSGLSAGK